MIPSFPGAGLRLVLMRLSVPLLAENLRGGYSYKPLKAPIDCFVINSKRLDCPDYSQSPVVVSVHVIRVSENRVS